MKEKIIRTIEKSSIFMLMFITMILIVTTTGFLCNITVTTLHLTIITILSIALFILFYKKDNIKQNIISILVALLVFIISICSLGTIYDTTSDGNTYHKLAIGSMKNGWNPDYMSSEDFTKEKGNVFDPGKDNMNTFWIDHYAKGTEIFGAVIYAFTSNIETAKIYTVLIMYSLFGLSLGYLSKRIGLISSIIISLLLVINPITIVQMNNLYVDAALGLTIIMIIYCLNIQNEDYKYMSKRETLFILAASIIWSINIKFTGLVYAAIICATFYVYILIKKYKTGKEVFISELKLQTIFYIVTLIISFMVVGYSSYVLNLVHNGNPLYPLYGDEAVQNIGVKEAPKSFQSKNRIETFLISIFSKGENVSASWVTENVVEPKLKIPFTFSKEEIKNYTIPDIRMGGFGPLFSGAFIIMAGVMIFILVKLIKNKKYKKAIPLILLLGVIAVIMLLFDGNYWARYIAFIYVLPIIALIYLLKNKDDKIKFAIGIILAIVMAINSGMILYANAQGIKASNKYVGTRLEAFKKYCEDKENVEITMESEVWQGVLYNLDDMDLLDKITVNSQTENANEDVYMFKYDNTK